MRLIQTYFDNRISFTEVAEDILKVIGGEWERGDFIKHIPSRPYELVLYIGSLMDIDVSRYYRYMWWTNKHIYYGVTEGPPILSSFNRGALHRMMFIAASQYVKWEVEQAGISVRDVIPHGVDIDRISNASPGMWRSLFGDSLIVLYVAHRHVRKGFRELVEAWKMSRAGRDSRVLLVLHTSRTPNTTENGYIIPENGNILITDNILKLNKESLYSLYKAADIYIHGAMAEGFGIPIVEAMAAGKPVICINAPPMNEHVTDSRCLVKVDMQKVVVDRGIAAYRLNYPDLKDMAEKIDWLVYAGKEIWDDIGQRNVETVKRKYSIWNYKRIEKYMDT